MKTKLSKKVLSAVLAIMMVVTSIPMMAFTALADAQSDAQAAINAYEAKINDVANNGTIYTNMGAAYDAYVDVHEAGDAVQFGGADVSILASAVSNLNTAVNNMQPYSVNFNGSAYHCNSLANDGYSNVVYQTNAPSGTANETTLVTEVAANDFAGAQMKYMVPKQIVVAYDGVNKVSVPAVLESFKKGKAMCSDLRLYYTKSNDSTFYFDTVWNGYQDGNWTSWPKNNIANVAKVSASGAKQGSDYIAVDNTSTSRFFWNQLVYHGTGNTTNYYETFTNTSLDMYLEYSNWGSKNITKTWTPSNTIYVINYKPVKDLLDGYATTLKNTFINGVGIDSFTQGGLADIMHAMGNLTVDATNPMTYSYTDMAAGVTSCANAIKSAVTTNTGKTVGAQDGAGYEAIRDAIPNCTASYNAGADAYRSGWTEFKAAYENAISIMANLPSTGYNNNTAAQAAADALLTAKANLVLNVSKIDTSELEALINSTQDFEEVFTSESMSNLQTVIANAKIAVWGSEANYPAEAYALDDTAENATILANQIANVQAAIRALRIDPNAKVNTDHGRMSLNDARALTPAHPNQDYTNYETTFGKQLTTSATYIANCPTTDLTDYATQVAGYKSLVNDVVNAYYGLSLSFTLTDDGAVTQVGGQSILAEIVESDQGDQSIIFDYTDSAVIIKTTHDAKDVTFGSVNIDFGTTIKTGSLGATNNNNMLDSISINTDVAEPEEGGFHIPSTQKGTSKSPNNLSDELKNGDYAGCLTNGNFEITKLVIDSYTYTCQPFDNSKFITGKDGSVLATSKAQAIGYDVTDILATSEGYTNNGTGYGGIFVKSSSGARASVFIKGDLTLHVPATTPQTLSSSTKPTSTDYKLQSYFGALSTYEVQNTTSQSGMNWFTSRRSGEQIDCNVSVIDASYLFDLINVCDAIVAGDGAQRYTSATYNKLVQQLAAAKTSDNLDVSTLSASTILQRLQTRYSNLWAAYTGLKVNTFAIDFVTKNQSGADVSTKLTVSYGETLSQYESQINAIDTSDYTVGIYKHEFLGWDPAIDMSAPVTAAATYTAQYNTIENQIDFTAYNEAKAQLLGALTDKTFSEAQMNELIATVNGLTYFNLTTDEQSAVPATQQSAVDTETARINQIKNGLTPCALDYSAAEAIVEAYRSCQADKDQWDVSAINDVKLTKTMNVLGEEVEVLIYDDGDVLDNVCRGILNNLNKMTYSIYLGDTMVATDVAYGTKVIVNSDGTVSIDVDDVTANYDGAKASWTYCYAAPSTDNTKTAAKYVLTSPSIGFTLKGDTYLTATPVETSASTYLVTVKTNTGNIIEVTTTSGSFTMPTAPNYAFYTFTGYDNGAKAGDVITVTENTTITANYTADTSATYTIFAAESLDAFYDGDVNLVGKFNYNEKVELAGNEDVYAWVVADVDDENGQYFLYLTHYGTSYSFYACESFGFDADAMFGKCIVPLTEDDYQSILKDSTVFTKVTGSLYADCSALDTATVTDPDSDYFGIPLLMDFDGTVYCCKSAKYKNLTAANPTTFEFNDPTPSVTSLDTVVPVNNGAKVEKFSMIGTYIVPEDCEIVECGFLFTSNTSVTNMTVEQVGTNGIARMKATRYTCGDQFVINIKNPSSTVNFVYQAYAIVKDADGNLVTVYAAPCTGSNVF